MTLNIENNIKPTLMQNSWLIRGLWSVNTNLIKNDDK